MSVASMAVIVCAWAATAATRTYSFPGDPEWETREITKEEVIAARRAKAPVIRHVFGDRAELIRRFNRISSRFVRAGKTIRVPLLAEGEGYEPLPPQLPGDDVQGKRILIVLDRQFLASYEDGVRVASYPIVTGKEDYFTPVGEFSITRKDEDHASSIYPEPDGGWPMPWAIRFKGRAYWIHGGDMTGRPSSHGCVRMFRKDAKILFEWAEIGTDVHVIISLPEE